MAADPVVPPPQQAFSPAAKSDGPVVPPEASEVTQEMIEAYDGAYTMARVAHARAGVGGWRLEQLGIRAGLEAIAPILVAAGRTRAAADIRAEVEYGVRWPGRWPVSGGFLNPQSARAYATDKTVAAHGSAVQRTVWVGPWVPVPEQGIRDVAEL